MAFLQRVINDLSDEALAKSEGGRIHREYALGRGRVDLLVEWPSSVKTSDFAKASSDKSADTLHQRIVIELKIKRSKSTIEDGLKQTAQYMDTNKATEGHLLVFDRASEKSWDEKIFTQEHHVGKDDITVWGL